MNGTTERKDIQLAIIKWTLGVLGTLILIGLVSIANRDVYSKGQVDEKLFYERELSLARDQTIKEIIQQQNGFVNDQLRIIREDQADIKAVLMKGER